MACESCGDKPKKCNKDFTKAVIEIDNPEQITLMRKVTIPASMGDDTTVPPAVGKYHNVLLYYEANQKSYLYSSDGIPTQLVNGVTDYEAAVNLPQINGVTLLGNKSAADLELADAPMVITVADGNTSWSGADTAEDVYNFFLNKGKVNIVFNGGENYAYEIDSAGYIPEEEKMMCTLTAATITAGETAEFDGNALVGTMTLYTADKAIDVSQIELQPKLYVADFTGLDLNYDTLSGVPATNAAIGMVKPGDGLEVDANGTMSISDIEQYAHFFDTVADMKAATDLIDGDYAKTGGFYSVNDNGSALYKIRQITNDDVVDEKFIIELADSSLVAELITGKMVNICQVGGQQNFSDVCNYVINAGKNIYVPGGDYEASSTIIFSNPSQMFVCDGNISFTGSSSTLFSVRASYNIIKLNGIIEAGVTNDCIRICDGSNATYSSEIYIHRIRTCRNGIMINPDSTVGCQCSDFTFGRIAASNAGIYIQAGDTGTPWVSASRFRGGEISAPYGIVTRKGANQTDNFNDLSFSRITFSGSIECALDLQFCGRCYFRELRIAEGLVGTYCIKLDASGYNIIENEYEIELSKVLITNETSSTSRNFIYAKCITDGGTYVGYRADTYKGYFIIPRSELLRPDKVYLGGSDGTFTTTPNFYYDGMTVMINSSNYGQTYNYTLPDPISQQGIKEFYLKVARQRSDTTNTLTDQNGKVVTVPSGALENVWYRVYLRNDTYGSAVWKLEEV